MTNETIELPDDGFMDLTHALRLGYLHCHYLAEQATRAGYPDKSGEWLQDAEKIKAMIAKLTETGA